ERVQRLWIADAPGLWVEEEPLPDLFRYMQEGDKIRQLVFHDPDCYMAELVFQNGSQDEQFLRAYQNLAVLARLLWERPYSPKLSSRLHRIQCPTLLIWGAQDHLVPPSYGQAYRQYLPHAELRLIPECGHLPMFEREDEFVDA